MAPSLIREIIPEEGLTTTEGGDAATFTVSLTSVPTDDVTIELSSSDPTECTVALSEPSGQEVSVVYENADGTITVAVNGDVAHEEDETFFVDLSGAGGAAILDGRGLGTIVNDDELIVEHWLGSGVKS